MSVTAAKGFAATGLHCGIKTDGVLDLAVITAERAVPAAAVFTTSTTAAPSVAKGREALSDGVLQAVVVASGCANAGTGQAGVEAIERVAAKAADLFDCGQNDVLVSTTGPIGPVLPDDLVQAGMAEAIGQLGADEAHGNAAAWGIVTTDSMTKEATHVGDGYVIGGMAKGAGMVRPDMATMLAFLTTDAVVSSDLLQSSLRTAVDFTFNCLNIDGCQSTNDTVLVMASEDSGVAPDPVEFERTLTKVCQDLVSQMASDAEGASRVVTLEISGAADDRQAREVGKSIADASLVRASFYGGDPNWGRLLAAAGATGHTVDAADISVSYEGVQIASGGVAVDHDEETLLANLEKGDFTIQMSVGTGAGQATIVTTDLTPDYVVFNGERS